MHCLKKRIASQMNLQLIKRSLSSTSFLAKEQYTADEKFTAGARTDKEMEQLKKSTFPNLVRMLSRDYDLTFKGIKRFLAARKVQIMEKEQDVVASYGNIQKLGYDLNATFFIMKEGGKVKFINSEDWHYQNEGDEADLPREPNKKLLIEALDLSKADLVYEGYSYLKNLDHIKSVNLNHNEYVDDFCLDKLCGLCHSSLKDLDISHCKNLTSSGLESIVKLRKLQVLIVEGLDHIPHLNFICLLLQESNPNLTIKGGGIYDAKSSPKITATSAEKS